MKADILNVFTPALAIGDAARFAGRQAQLEHVAHALQSDGTQIVIFGNRGVGKSSLARQLEGIARGDMSVIERLRVKPHSTPDYLVISIECDDTITDIRTLILRLLTDDAALAPWIPWKVEKLATSSEASAGFDIKVIRIAGKTGDTQTLVQDTVDSDLYATFGNAIAHILDSKVVAGVLFIIDEVDRIRNRSELASIIRSRGSDPRVKFALVGVSTTPQELITNHESIVRQISDGCIEMPPMNREELREIFNQANEVLKDDGIYFDDASQDWIIDIAKGHPYYVHLLGKHSLLRAATDGMTVITKDFAEEVLAEIANKGTATVQESTYKKAIGHSYVREFILKAFASVPNEEINTTSIYAKIAEARKIDVGTISVYVGQLVTSKYGGSIEKTRERHYRFKDSLFKAYAAARTFQYDADKVEQDDVG